MTMVFIKRLVEKQQASVSLAKLVDKRLAGFEEQRSHKIIHISDLSRGNSFCPREFALLDKTGKKPKGMYLSAALRVAFDNGSALSDLCRNKWLEWDVVGHWKCGYCAKRVEFAKKPKTPCPKCKANLWRYEEVTIVNPHNGVTGSIDFLIDFGTGKHVMVECKTMSRDIFAELKAPLAEHRVRTQLYLLHWSQVTGPHANKVDTEKAIVFYISKGFGTKDESQGGKITPFKDYIVERDDAAVMSIYQKADPVYAFRNGGPMPHGICENSFSKRAKYCPVHHACFGGDYPPGK